MSKDHRILHYVFLFLGERRIFQVQFGISESLLVTTPRVLLLHLTHVSLFIYGVTLTDVVVALSLAELLAQRERCEALKLFGELLRRVGGEGPGALPAQLIERVRLAHLVVLQVHHVEDVALGLLRQDLATLVVRADDVQVVVDVHVHRVLVTYEPGEREGEKKR